MFPWLGDPSPWICSKNWSMCWQLPSGWVQTLIPVLQCLFWSIQSHTQQISFSKAPLRLHTCHCIRAEAATKPDRQLVSEIKPKTLLVSRPHAVDVGLPFLDFVCSPVVQGPEQNNDELQHQDQVCQILSPMGWGPWGPCAPLENIHCNKDWSVMISHQLIFITWGANAPTVSYWNASALFATSIRMTCKGIWHQCCGAAPLQTHSEFWKTLRSYHQASTLPKTPTGITIFVSGRRPSVSTRGTHCCHVKVNQSQLAPVPHDVAQMSIAMDAHLMACWAYGFPMVSFLYSDNAFQKKFHEIPRFHQPHTVSIGYLIGNIWTPRICWSGHALARKCIIRR